MCIRDRDKEPKYSIKECKERDVTFAAPLRVTARLLNKETGEVKDQEIFMGDFPLMTCLLYTSPSSPAVL